ncbi:hypothetical protein O6H91_Y264100 [Diphasiastrum complanatum]|nr:hypothetical protein O6H91_Y264100 [Diphasiastrum complanatum]
MWPAALQSPPLLATPLAQIRSRGRPPLLALPSAFDDRAVCHPPASSPWQHQQGCLRRRLCSCHKGGCNFPGQREASSLLREVLPLLLENIVQPKPCCGIQALAKVVVVFMGMKNYKEQLQLQLVVEYRHCQE